MYGPETRLVTAQLAVQRERAMTWPCKWCGAAIGKPCVNPTTRAPLVHLPAHNQRLLASGAI